MDDHLTQGHWARGLSQQQPAGVAGVTRQAVSAVESGHCDPSLRVALGLARALGVSIEELFGHGEPADLPGYHSRAAGHLQVAAAVAGRIADAGVSSEPAALAYDLDFLPLASERFDLVLPSSLAASREVQGLLKVLTSPWLLAQLASLPGYDPSTCGERIR